MSCSRSENVKQSNGIDIYLTGIVIGKKSTNQIAQYKVMVEVSTAKISRRLQVWGVGRYAYMPMNCAY